MKMFKLILVSDDGEVIDSVELQVTREERKVAIVQLSHELTMPQSIEEFTIPESFFN